MEKRRYWGLAAFSVVWILVQMVLSEGRPMGGVSVMWMFVTYHAIRGHADTIRMLANAMIWMQIIVGGLTFLWLSTATDPSMQIYFGTPVIFLISIGVPTLLWYFVFLYARGQVERPQAVSPPSKVIPAAPDRSTDARTPPPLPTGDDNAPNAATGAEADSTRADQPSTPASNLHDTAGEGKAVSDQRPEEDEVNLSDFPKAQMAIEYRREAEEAWSQAQHLPTAYMRRFLEALDEDPKCDALEALSSLEEEFKKEQRPFDDAAANDALEEVRTISPEAALEFKRVYETFGETVPLPELLRRIKAKYGPMAKNLSLEKKKATAIAALNEAIRHVDASGITGALTALSYEIQVATSSGLLFKRYRVTEPKEKGGRSFDLFNDPDLIAFARKLSIQHGQPPTS